MADEAPDPLVSYVTERFAREDAVLADLRAALERDGFPLIQVPAATGRALELLVRLSGARTVLEVGTLGGYSAIWMGRALPPGGRLTTVELNPDHARLARTFIDRAGLQDRVHVLEGNAREVLPTLGPDGSVDLVFLDADKEGYLGYAREGLRLLRPGGLLVADNALWSGRVLETDPDETSTRAVQAYNDWLAGSGMAATILPVGDGLALGVKPV